MNQQGSHDATTTPFIIKWRTPPTVGEMWSHPSEQLVCVPQLCVQMLYINFTNEALLMKI